MDLPRPGRPTKVIDKEKEMVIETIDAQPDLSLGQLIEESQVDISKTKLWWILKEYGYQCRTAPEKMGDR